MSEPPKRIHLYDDGNLRSPHAGMLGLPLALKRYGKPADDTVDYVRGNIADGYRAALERMVACTWTITHDRPENARALDAAREALAKGDEG